MNPIVGEAFKQIDAYTRQQLGCFIAEVLCSGPDSHKFCFRPTNHPGAPADIYACKYLTVSDNDLEACARARNVTRDVQDLLHRELAQLAGKKLGD